MNTPNTLYMTTFTVSRDAITCSVNIMTSSIVHCSFADMKQPIALSKLHPNCLKESGSAGTVESVLR